ncbi:MAG: hypothetical protein LQ341_002413 [Variospora aurantia]|nr:MAG: hypothetical protein LQ341_002413 [Variospora aurantia]
MGFADFVTDAGLSMLESWVTSRSYISGYGPSQADVASFKALPGLPKVEKYPHAWRWYKHIASYQSGMKQSTSSLSSLVTYAGSEFSSLPGDPSKAYTSYGPEKSEATLNPKDAPKAAAEEEEEDDDLFGSDDESEDEETKKKREENLAAYKKKKEGKTKPAAKSIVTLDVKPWDDETDMKQLEENMRKIVMDGLTWGASKLVPLAFGIKKLQVNLVVEDEKVSIDDLQQQIEGDEDYVQSTDVAAMQKL